MERFSEILVWGKASHVCKLRYGDIGKSQYCHDEDNYIALSLQCLVQDQRVMSFIQIFKLIECYKANLDYIKINEFATGTDPHTVIGTLNHL